MKENLVVTVGANPLLRSLGIVANQPVDVDKLKLDGQQMADKYAELRAMAESREVVNSVSIWDLMDMDKLVDENLITEADMEMIQISPQIRKMVQGIKSLGVEFDNDDFKDLSLITSKLIDVPKNVCIKLYEGLKDIINDPTIDSDIDDILINATADLISEKATFENFVRLELGLDLEDISQEEMESLQRSKFESFLEWKRVEAERLLTEVIQNPLKTAVILPIGFDEVKQTMINVLPVEAVDWVESLKAGDVITGETWEYIKNNFAALGQAQKIAIAKAMQKFLDDNGSAVDVGGQVIPVMFSVNIAEIILHTLILASADLFNKDEDEDLSEDTKYVVELYDYVLHNDTELRDRISPETAYRLLSTIQGMIPLATARSSQIRSVNRDYNIATTTITTFINDDIMSSHVDNMSDEEKAKLEKNIIGK